MYMYMNEEWILIPHIHNTIEGWSDVALIWSCRLRNIFVSISWKSWRLCEIVTEIDMRVPDDNDSIGMDTLLIDGCIV